MSESNRANVLVSFRLDRDRPLRIAWLAEGGGPGDGYKAQVTAILLADGTRLAMHGTSIMEQVVRDGDDYVLSFNGIVGYAADHVDRARIDQLREEEVDYELELVHEDGRVAVEARDYRIADRPRAIARNLSHA